MYAGKLVFAQLTEDLPLPVFRQCVQRYGGHRKVKSLKCLDQFLCMTFAQLTYRESLRDIEACLRAHQTVKSQIWIAIATYVLVAILKKRLNIDASLYTLLQVLSLTLFERTPINQFVTDRDYDSQSPLERNQLTLFD